MNKQKIIDSILEYLKAIDRFADCYMGIIAIDLPVSGFTEKERLYGYNITNDAIMLYDKYFYDLNKSVWAERADWIAKRASLINYLLKNE